MKGSGKDIIRTLEQQQDRAIKAITASTSGHGIEELYASGVDLVLSGHDHDYERFSPLDADGRVDKIHGIRSFIVGTGGAHHAEFGTIKTGSEVRNNDTFGVLKLVLHQTGYEWEFVPEVGKSFADRGNARCH